MCRQHAATAVPARPSMQAEPVSLKREADGRASGTLRRAERRDYLQCVVDVLAKTSNEPV